MTSMTLTTTLLQVNELAISGDGVTIAPISFTWKPVSASRY